MAESVSVIRVAYLGQYCLEIRLRAGGLVAVRDAAYSRFDRTTVVNEFTPTPGLKVIIFTPNEDPPQINQIKN